MRHSVVGGLFIVLGLAMGLPVRVRAEDVAAKWQSFDFSTQAADSLELESLPLESLKQIRGVVFGRHGRIFKEQDIQGYLVKQPWYKPDSSFSNSVLTEKEHQNLDLIRGAEAHKHAHVEPGDLRFWEDRRLTDKDLQGLSLSELRILEAEAQAIHGKHFPEDPWMQNYFNERYWYRPEIVLSFLSYMEQQNLEKIRRFSYSLSSSATHPGDMILFQDKLLTEAMLQGASLFDLRLMRNEIYARRGRRFKTPWIRDWFEKTEWYTPREDDAEPKLSDMEVKNIATIVKVENRIHEELGTKPLSSAQLQSLYLEDARKLRFEIEARHGKVFDDKWLQGYFASFKWYRPHPSYTESQLSQVEHANVEAIRIYEGTARAFMDTFEG